MSSTDPSHDTPARPLVDPHEIYAKTELYRRRRLKAVGLLETLMAVGDFILVALSFIIGYSIRFQTILGSSDHQGPSFIDYSWIIFLGTLITFLCLIYFRSYGRRTFFRAQVSCGRVFKAAAVGCFLLLSFELIFHYGTPISRQFVVVSFVLCAFSLILWRLFVTKVLVPNKLGAKLRQRILFVGWTVESAKLASTISRDLSLPYVVEGCVLGPSGRIQRSVASEAAVLGAYTDLPDILSTGRIDILVLTDLDVVRGEVLGLAALCEQYLVDFKIIPSYFQIFISALQLETLSGIPVLGVHKLPLDYTLNRILKRLVDILGGLFGLLLAAPIILICGVLIWLESPGPIFYRQKRMARHGKLFEIIKLRSMRLDAEKDGPKWSKKGDDRRLKIGKTLREWNLDELPQFWNVLKGDMSLVGPRPERPEFIDKFKYEIPNYHMRHLSKPGITGWAQVNGLRGESDLNERIQADLYYLEHWSLLLDFQIMLRTLMTRKNAG